MSIRLYIKLKIDLKNMKIKKLKYPVYYNVDDIPVVLELENNIVIGKTANGSPYQIGKAIVEGYKITKAKYIKLAKDLYNRSYSE